MLKVEGAAWSDFFKSVTDTVDGKETGKAWKRRFPSDSHPMRVLFFRPDEAPINALSGHFQPKGPPFYLMLESQGKTSYVEVDYRTYSDRDFQVGSGLTTYPHPPGYLFYPYRMMGLWIALAGVCFYFLVPTARKAPDGVRYDRWRVCLGDFVGYAFIFLPLAIPICVVGGTRQGFSEGFLIFLFLSPLLAGGLFVLYLTASFGSFEMVPLREALQMESFWGRRIYPYAEMAFFQYVMFKPPRWLILLSWLMVLMSAGTARMGAAGRALMLSSSGARGIAIQLKSGAALFVNITDQMGGAAIKGFEAILEELRKKGIPEKSEERQIRSLGFETVRLAK